MSALAEHIKSSHGLPRRLYPLTNGDSVSVRAVLGRGWSGHHDESGLSNAKLAHLRGGALSVGPEAALAERILHGSASHHKRLVASLPEDLGSKTKLADRKPTLNDEDPVSNRGILGQK